MRLLKPLLLLGYMFSLNYSYAQIPKPCITDQMFDQFMSENPSVINDRKALEAFTKDYENQHYKKAVNVKIIPIVFHIIHDYGSENISKEHVLEGLSIINEDFRKLNADTSTIDSAFKGIAADSEIEFRLAQKDPNGNCTDGITRTVSALTHIADNDVKDLVRWPNERYLNVWLVNSIASGAGGYAYYPGASSDIDGIVLRSGQFGIGYRSLTHEIGHYLNLPHTWGSTNDPEEPGNCSMDDGVGDTPNTIGNTACDLNAESCGSKDNVQNYMEYSFCDRMFTEGQKARMHAALNSSLSGRNNLWTASNLALTGTDGNNNLCQADFTSDQQVVCAGSVVSFEDLSFNGQTGWSWFFEGGSPTISANSAPVVAYHTPGTYQVSLTVTDGSDSITQIKTAFITVQPVPGNPMPLSESFENFSFTNSEWLVINEDQGNTWELCNNAALTGSNSLLMENYGNGMSRKDEFVSCAYDLSDMQSVLFSFSVAFAQPIDTTNDILRLWVSRDCGVSWALRWVGYGSNMATAPVQSSFFVPSNPNHWADYSVTNIDASFMTDGFRFKFEFICDGGNNLYLDDINITGNSQTVPMLVSPYNFATGILATEVLNWNAVQDVDYYEYQLDTSIVFSSPILFSGTNSYISFDNNGGDTEQEVSGLTPSTTYYWRVRSATNGVLSNWSAVWTFSTGSYTGIQNIADNWVSMRVSPNPITDESTVYIRLRMPTSNVRIAVIDLCGRISAVLYEGPLNTFPISFPVKDIVKEPGIFFLRLELDNRVSKVQKIIMY